jgi:membrane-associated phospholipid phosphatase
VIILMRAPPLARVLVCVLAFVTAAPSGSSAQVAPPRADTARLGLSDQALFTRSDTYLALGFAAGAIALLPLDRHMSDILRDPTVQANAAMRNAAASLRFLGFPGSVIIASSMYAVGRMADMPRIAAIGLHGAEAIAVATGVVYTSKAVVGRARPDHSPDDPYSVGLLRGLRGSDYRAFPSGHTAAAFALASAVTAETLTLWPDAMPFAGPALYTGAALVGVSRIYHSKHWPSDVVAAAALGTFSGLKVVRYHYLNPDNYVDRLLLSAGVVPAPGGMLLVFTLPAP